MTKEIIENEDEFAKQLQAACENQNTQVSSESKKNCIQLKTEWTSWTL